MAAAFRDSIGTAAVLAAMALAVVALAACAPTPLRPPPDTSQVGGGGPGSVQLAHVADVAKSRVGAPYQYGEDGPTAFDCSGLVYYAYHRVGIAVPRTVRQLREVAFPVKAAHARPGDLLFFRLSGKVRHVAIYVGHRRFVHAPNSGSRVSIASLDNPYWRRHLVEVGRFF
ncbi:MAG TPA: C40 family peptidase [Gammaproteobacteria bacterium]|nr:C40 family peptidase [Gammaproteobacteria bacterium]